MTNILSKEFSLDEKYSEGALILPGCRVVLKYESINRALLNDEGKIQEINGKKSRTDDNAPNRESSTEYTRARDLYHTICNRLILLLVEIPGMEDPDVRGSLLSFLTRGERARLWGKRRPDDIDTDLSLIIEHADSFDRLHMLVDNAVRRPQSERSKSELWRIKQEYIGYLKLKRTFGTRDAHLPSKV